MPANNNVDNSAEENILRMITNVQDKITSSHV